MGRPVQSQQLPRDVDTFLPLPWPVPLPGMFFPVTRISRCPGTARASLPQGCFRLEGEVRPDAPAQ